MEHLIAKLRNVPQSLRAVASNFGWLLAHRGLAAVLSLIYLAIITRSLGVSGFGKFALITGVARVLTDLLAFQTWQIIVQYGVTHVANGDETRLARLFRSSLLLDAISAVTGIVAAAIILHLVADDLGIKDTLARATLIFNIIMLLSIRSTPLGILRLRDRFALAAASESATPVFRLIGAVIVGIVHPTLQAFMIAWAIAELLTAGAYWLAVSKIGDLDLITRSRQNLRQVFADNPGIVHFALTTNFSQTLGMGARQVPLLLVGGFVGTAAAGAFRLAAQLAQALTKVSQMIARAAFPEIVRLVRLQGAAQFSALILRATRYALVLGALVFILVALVGEQALILIGGADFGSGYAALLWLAAAGCIELVVVGFEPVAMAAHRAHLAFVARLAATGAMLVLAFFLLPRMGGEGVAAAVFGYSVVLAVLLTVVMGRMIRQGKVIAPLPKSNDAKDVG